MTQPLLPAGSVAVVTGGASGIGLAAAARFAAMGLQVCIADLGEQRLDAAVAVLPAMRRRAPGRFWQSRPMSAASTMFCVWKRPCGRVSVAPIC